MIRKLAAAVIAASFATAGIAQATTTIRVGTQAPKESPWGKLFSTWSKAVDKKTDGQVQITWLWNGTAGPESNMVGKIRSGQITGAAITAVGLSDIYKPIVALQMPGAFKTWAELDRARDALKPEFDKEINAQGFYVGGWGDVGVGHMMSHGFEVRVPEDLRGKTPGYLTADLIAPKLFEVIGGVTPKPADVTEFLPLLSAGSINVLAAPALAAEQLQWTSRLDHMSTGVGGFGVGALVLSDSELNKIPEDQRDVVKRTGTAMNEMLTKVIRKDDAEAFERLKKKMTTHEETDAERDAWEKVFKKACVRVKSALPGDVLAKIGYC
jgi:TRAP-type C4-dicarboxylate transport system substrate-binding protein